MNYGQKYYLYRMINPMVYTPRLPNYSNAVIAPVLTDILNTSITLGTYPSKLKMAKITPVFKGDDDTDANNYETHLFTFKFQ